MSIEFGQRVSAQIEREELSQRRLAKKAGVSHTTIHHIVNGRRGASPQMALVLSKALEIHSSGKKVEFNLLAAGYTVKQVEEILGRPITDLDNIRQDKIKKIVRGKTVIRYRF